MPSADALCSIGSLGSRRSDSCVRFSSSLPPLSRCPGACVSPVTMAARHPLSERPPLQSPNHPMSSQPQQQTPPTRTQPYTGPPPPTSQAQPPVHVPYAADPYARRDPFLPATSHHVRRSSYGLHAADNAHGWGNAGMLSAGPFYMFAAVRPECRWRRGTRAMSKTARRGLAWRPEDVCRTLSCPWVQEENACHAATHAARACGVCTAGSNAWLDRLRAVVAGQKEAINAILFYRTHLACQAPFGSSSPLEH